MLQLMITGFLDIRLLDIIDILLVALLMFELYHIVKGTAAINILIGILAVFLMWKLVDALQMELLSEILGAFISVGFIALIVVFQPEIRRFLLLLGTPTFISKKKNRWLFWRPQMNGVENLDVDKIVKAVQEMSNAKTGALIVIAKQNELGQYTESGTVLDAVISESLLRNIFFGHNPLHDGAMIIVHNRIKAAACVLPITKNTEFPEGYGLRHRAAVGVTENTDAIAVVVSEESGGIAYTKNGHITTLVSASDLKNFLEEEFN